MTSLDRIVSEAQAFIAERGAALDASTTVWLDKVSTQLAKRTSFVVLVHEWYFPPPVPQVNRSNRGGEFPERLAVAKALVASTRLELRESTSV
jgi:hypothetical protein